MLTKFSPDFLAQLGPNLVAEFVRDLGAELLGWLRAGVVGAVIRAAALVAGCTAESLPGAAVRARAETTGAAVHASAGTKPVAGREFGGIEVLAEAAAAWSRRDAVALDAFAGGGTAAFAGTIAWAGAPGWGVDGRRIIGGVAHRRGLVRGGQSVLGRLRGSPAGQGEQQRGRERQAGREHLADEHEQLLSGLPGYCVGPWERGPHGGRAHLVLCDVPGSRTPTARGYCG